MVAGLVVVDLTHVDAAADEIVPGRVDVGDDEHQIPVGDATLLWRAAQTLGIEREAAAPAATEQLLEVGARVRFRHPLVRSAVYGASSAADRQAAHSALAAATDPETDPDRRAWHRAHAATAPDEEVAGELIHCASGAQRRGGVAAAAAFLERAVVLTPDPSERASRALSAAQAKFAAGDLAAAESLLAAADVGPLDELGRAQVQRVRAQIAFDLRRGSDAPPLLLRAAQRLERLDAELARETYLEALVAAIYAGRLATGTDVADVALAARSAPLGPEPLPAQAAAAARPRDPFDRWVRRGRADVEQGPARLSCRGTATGVAVRGVQPRGDGLVGRRGMVRAGLQSGRARARDGNADRASVRT